ncbi:MAG TPA: hypothetical protein VE046_12255 [Steroidobacteraceae bacterium]|nr:hypothetical protein [Steroidobacteraceae bacterium]
MLRATLLTVSLFALVPALPFMAKATAAPAKLTAAQVVERNMAARGGLEKWRGVKALSWAGKMDAGGGDQRRLNVKIPGMPPPPPPSKEPAAQVQLPFVLEMERPRKSRLEIEFNGQTAVQVYDGTHGWKLRPFLNRREVETFTPAELEAAGMQSEFDGALVDYAAKGTKVELEGLDKVEGKDAYKLKLTLKNGHVVHEWIDANSFLDVKLEGTPRKLDGKLHEVAIFMRDYRPVNGLQIPHLLETVVKGVPRTEKIQIEKVVVNPRLDESRFSRPT